MNADGSNQVNLTPDSNQSEYNPSWSPDGTKIVFTSNRDGDEEIYSMDAEGRNITRLTNSPLRDYGPSWSPDGTKIAFSSQRNGASNAEIYTMNPDGSNPTRLTNNTSADDYSPSWSPDSSKIVFSSGSRIASMTAGGGGILTLTPTSQFNTAPTYSPDGSKIVFMSYQDSQNESNADLYTMNADGSGQLRLTNTPTIDGYPSWRGLNLPQYVGTSGAFGADCAGFLLAKQGLTNVGFITFDTPSGVPRSDMRIVANTNPDAASFSFTLTTTQGIGRLQHGNIRDVAIVNTVSLPANTKNVLILCDKTTGLVTDIVPYTP
jgi:hypothetical protein